MWYSLRTERVAASMTNNRSGLAPVRIRSPATARDVANEKTTRAAQAAQRPPILAGDMLTLPLNSSEIRYRGRASRPPRRACQHPNSDTYSSCPGLARATSTDRSNHTNPPPWAGTTKRRRRTDQPPSRGRRWSHSRRRSPSPALRPRALRPAPPATDPLCGWSVSIRSCDRTPRLEVTGEKIRIVTLNVGVDAHAEVHPAPQQVAVMVGAVVGVAEAGIRFMVATARAQMADPAGFAMGSLAVDGLVDEGAETRAVDAGGDVAECRQFGAREAMTQVEVACTVDGKQPDAGAARQRFATTLVQIGHQLVHVGEAVVGAAQRCLAIVLSQAFEGALHLRKFGVGERVTRLGRGGHGRITHFMEADLASKMGVDGLHF